MFIVIELQTNGEQTANIVNAYTSRPEAEARYHSILAAAALSNVQIHSAVLMDHRGFTYLTECYDRSNEAGG